MPLNTGSVSSNNELELAIKMPWLKNNRQNSGRKKLEANLQPEARSEDAHSQSPKKQAKEDKYNPEVSDFVPPKEEQASASESESPQFSIPETGWEEIPKNDFPEWQECLQTNWETTGAEEDSTTALRALVPKAEAEGDYFKGILKPAKTAKRREKKKIWTAVDLAFAKEEIATVPQAEQRPVVTPEELPQKELPQKELPKKDEFVELTKSMKKYWKICEAKEEPKRYADVEVWLNKSSTYFDSPEAKPEQDDLKDDRLPNTYYADVDYNMIFIDTDDFEEPTEEDKFEENIFNSQPADFTWDKKTTIFFENHNQNLMKLNQTTKTAFSPVDFSVDSDNAVFSGNHSSMNNNYSALTTQCVEPQPTLLANNWCCPTCDSTVSHAPSPSLKPRQKRTAFPIYKKQRMAMEVQRDNDQYSDLSGNCKVVGVEQKPFEYRYGLAMPILGQTKPERRNRERKHRRRSKK